MLAKAKKGDNIMKKVNAPKVGQLVKVPVYEFAPMRSGWNGWIFRVGIIEKLYISKAGNKCARVRYCSGLAGRNQVTDCHEYSKGWLVSNVFQYEGNLANEQKSYDEYKACEENGEVVCWDEDTAFLLKNGFIQ